MSKIIGVTVGTPTSPKTMEQEINPVKTVNGVSPDENGNVEVKGGGGTEILTFDSVEEMNASTVPDGTIALVPSEVG